ncbi:UDP-2,4-diacetamido-2,4,6-trideoxy-beta-L-altropyranose hydrolase [uncultured Anaerovibrio sp.]|uniref:UDP-2,4-diacetamido-2,4, 6-trideoxy-beta-L-altropyranose hydrolase n=1 Tax=uncultured Anaerovibrio sp. TaxID=361586 RepID=UPI002606EF82|nr:UDP-2,4-diacetamido-2,4,6-trideoxy-beta-L-altropyranose hydrolase [uncultured Anaerovibrio sp.]
MYILIRVDSSTLIGSGHLMRCLTLAERHRQNGDEVTFICRDLAGNLSGLVQDNGFKLVVLPRSNCDKILTGYEKWLTVSQEQDAADVVKIIQQLGKVNRVVIDSYAIDEKWEKIVRPYTDELFVIDDLANRKHDCDILLDQNFYLNKEERYKELVPEQCKLLLGPEHALLREEFYLAKEKMKPRDGKLHNILVFYGGADATNETSKAIEALSLLKSNGELQNVNITVVVGGSNLRNESISNHCLKEDFKYLCQVNNMAELMAEADLMLGAGGTTTWERCFLSLPAIVTAVAENQFHICDDCATAGIIHYLGQWNKVTIYDICEAVRKFTNSEMSISMQKKMSQLFS